MVQRTVNAEVKAGLRSSIIVHDLDICCPKGYCSFINITAKVQTQETIFKDFCSKKAKTKDLKPTSSCINAAEPLEQEKKDRKDKKEVPIKERAKRHFGN